MSQDQASDSASCKGSIHVDGILDRCSIGRPFLVGREGPEAQDFALRVDRDDGAEGPAPSGNPCFLLCEGPWNQIKGGRGVLDFVVVNRGNGRGIGHRGLAHEDARGGAG